MFKDVTKYRVLQPFFRKPTEKWQLREVSRETGVSLPSVRSYIQELVDDGLLETVEGGTYPGYRASMDDVFKLYKRLETVRQLHETGVVDVIASTVHPDAIVLFGSAARGEDTEQSDIDLLVVAGEKPIDLQEYEDVFNRTINLQFVTTAELLDADEFANSVANGVVLQGFLTVK